MNFKTDEEYKEFEHLIVNGEKIIILTPIPYEIEISEENKHEQLFHLNESVRFLFDVLNVLNISISEARKQEYTLNTITGDRLRGIARIKEVSHEVELMIIKNKW